MRLQLNFALESAGLTNPVSNDDALTFAKELQATLAEHGIASKVEHDDADIGEDEPDWALLSKDEQARGGYTYTEVVTEHAGHASLSIFRTALFFSSEEDFGAAQASAAHVVTMLRALEPRIKVSDQDWAAITAQAADLAVDAEGNVERQVLEYSELEPLAIQLFDRSYSPEQIRPWAEEFVTARHGEIRAAARAAIPLFRASIAGGPDGISAEIRMPRESSGKRDLPGFDRLRDAMQTLLADALKQPWQDTGLPTGVVVTKTPARIETYLVFDNLLGSGAIEPALLEDATRSSPHAWEAVTSAAAQRDPRFQPSWLPEAVGLLDRAGQRITINAEPLAGDDVQPTGARDIRVPEKKAPPPPPPTPYRRPAEPYLPPLPPEKKPGLLGRMFGRKK